MRCWGGGWCLRDARLDCPESAGHGLPVSWNIGGAHDELSRLPTTWTATTPLRTPPFSSASTLLLSCHANMPTTSWLDDDGSRQTENLQYFIFYSIFTSHTHVHVLFVFTFLPKSIYLNVCVCEYPLVYSSSTATQNNNVKSTKGTIFCGRGTVSQRNATCPRGREPQSVEKERGFVVKARFLRLLLRFPLPSNALPPQKRRRFLPHSSFEFSFHYDHRPFCSFISNAPPF